MGFFKKTPKEKATDQFNDAAERAAEIAGSVAHTIAGAASSAYNWAAPRVEHVAEQIAPAAQDAATKVSGVAHNAYDKARPYVDEAASKARPYFDEATAKARPYVDDAAAKVGGAATLVRDDYLPRAKRAANAALEEAKKSDGDLKKTAKKVAKASKKELAKQQKSGKKGKVFGVVVLLAAAAGAAYVAWARSKPIEDPWAEAYWEDVAASADPADGATDSVLAQEDETANASMPEEVIEFPESLAEAEEGTLPEGEEEENSIPTPLDIATKFEENENKDN